MIYEFWWDNHAENELMEIDETNEVKIGKLLDEFREGKKYYDFDEWCAFLEEKGYTIRVLTKECSIYF